MLWRWRKNDCPECGEGEPISNVNLEVTQLDVNDFPLWVKFILVKSQGWGEGFEDLFVWLIVLLTAAILVLPPLSKRFDQLTGVAPPDPAPSAQPDKAKTTKGGSQPQGSPAKALKWSGELAQSPQKGDHILSYTVTSPFGHREQPNASGASTEHKGVDVGVPEGTPLFAMGLPGSKVKVACNKTEAGGNQAFLRSDSIPGKEFAAAHLSVCNAGVYDAGKSFGKSGNTGSATEGPHLHFEERDLAGQDPNGTAKPLRIPPAKGHIIWMLQGTPPALPSSGAAPLSKALEGTPVLPKANGDGSDDAQPIYDKLMPSVVQIFNGLQGSGFVVSEDGKVLTNWHVVDDAAAAARGYGKGPHTLKFADGKTYSFKILKSDKNLDIALLQIEAPAGTKFTPLPFASALPKLGDDVFAITNEEGKFPHKARGKIVALITVGESIAQIETTNGFIKDGASGSAGVNRDGEIIMQNKAVLQANGGKDAFGRVVTEERNGDGLASTAQQLQEFIK